MVGIQVALSKVDTEDILVKVPHKVQAELHIQEASYHKVEVDTEDNSDMRVVLEVSQSYYL
jgi:hypothetical protein